MSFEVASVRPGKPDEFFRPSFPLDTSAASRPIGGRFSAIFPLATFIKFAYKTNLTPDQTRAMVGGLPKWVTTDRFVSRREPRAVPPRTRCA